MQNMKTSKHNNEQGIVSLMVTIILMLVISLIVISFARTSRREQRDALDRQLSTNAFYAAESGVNAARNAIANDPNLIGQYTSSCTGAGSFMEKANLTGVVGPAGSNASYTCLFVDPTVNTIEHTIGTEPFIFPLKPAPPANAFGTVDVFYDAAPKNPDYDTCPDKAGPNPNPLTSNWPGSCGAGILRVELTDDALNSRVFFIYPSSTKMNNINFNTAKDNTGSTYNAKCSTATKPYQCHFQIALGNQTVYARVNSLYARYQLSVSAGNKAFADAQLMVDATGKAADVQRRIQVRINLNDFGGPLYALQARTSLCKKFSVDGTNVTDSGNCWPSPYTRSPTSTPPTLP